MTTLTLAGTAYPCKVVENVRFIKDRGHWLKSTTFVDRLVIEDRLDELADLARIGQAATKGKLTFGSAQETATALHGARVN